MSRQLRMVLAAILALASAGLTLGIYFNLQPERVVVVVTTRDVEPFTTLNGSNLEAVEVDAATAGRLFPHAYTTPAQVAGRVSLRRLRAGEVLLRSDPALAQAAQVGRALTSGALPLSARIPEGYRAVAVRAGEAGAAPGDYIQLFRVTPGAASPVLNRPLQVVAADGGSLMVLVAEGEELATLLPALAQGQIKAVLAPAVAGEQGAET